MADSERKQDALKAIAGLIGELTQNGEAARWIDAGRLAQMGGAIARIGEEARVADFDQFGNVQNAWGGFQGVVGGGPMLAAPRPFGDMQALDRAKLLTEGTMVAAATDAVRSLAATQETTELKTLLEIKNALLTDRQRAAIDRRIDHLITAMEARNDQSTRPVDPTEHARGRPPRAAHEANHQADGVRADAGRGAGDDGAPRPGNPPAVG